MDFPGKYGKGLDVFENWKYNGEKRKALAVGRTYADTGTDLRTGLRRFAQWYAEFYPRKE